MIWIILIAVGLSAFYLFVHKPKQYFKKHGIPYLESAPIFGEMLPVVLQRMSLFENVQRIYNQIGDARYHGIFMFVTPCIVIKDPELIKDIAIKHFDNFTDHTTLVSNELDAILGNSLLTLRGAVWKNMRSILNPAFSSKLKPMFPLMHKCSEEFLSHLKNKCKDQKTTILNMSETFSVITNNVISSCAFGFELNSFKEPDNEFYKISKDITDLRGIRGLTLFLTSLSVKFMKIVRWSFLSAKENNYFRKLFMDAVQYREEKNIVRPDVIDLLLKAKNGQIKEEENINAEERIGDMQNLKLEVDDDIIVAQSVALLVGGFSTVANVMCFTSYELALNPDVQDKLIKEVDKVLLENGGNVTYKGLMEMKYFDMILCEISRLYPTFAITDRVCTNDFVLEEDNGKQTLFRKGLQIQFPISALARDPKYFPNPDKFDPERFNNENKDLIISGTYIPFGLGPRVCLGKRFALIQTKAMLATLLTNFKIVSVKETQIPIKICKSSISTIPETDLHLGLEKR